MFVAFIFKRINKFGKLIITDIYNILNSNKHIIVTPHTQYNLKFENLKLFSRKQLYNPHINVNLWYNGIDRYSRKKHIML